MSNDILAKLAAPFPPEVVAAFMDKILPEPNSGCWLWTGSTNSGGYGNFWLAGKSQKAHRVSHMLFKGPIPDGLDVMHKCDVPCCVNPDHIRAGTTLENVRELWAKKRGNPPRGERNAKARLTSDGVIRIRELDGLIGLPTAEIARRFEMSNSQVRRVIRRGAGGWQ